MAVDTVTEAADKAVVATERAWITYVITCGCRVDVNVITYM